MFRFIVGLVFFAAGPLVALSIANLATTDVEGTYAFCVAPIFWFFIWFSGFVIVKSLKPTSNQVYGSMVRPRKR